MTPIMNGVMINLLVAAFVREVVGAVCSEGDGMKA